MPKFFRVVVWVAGAILLSTIALAAYQAIKFNPGGNPAAITEDFLDPALSRWTIKLVDGMGQAQPPPYHGGSMTVRDGTLRLEVSPDPNFGAESAKWQSGQAAAAQYNNTFAIGLAGFAPTRTQKVVIEFSMKIDPAYQGTAGLWLESANTFNPQGVMDSSGFNAFGLSYTSPESTKLIAGLKFEYAKGFFPLCIGSVSGVDPTQWNVYRIEWSKSLGFIDRFKMYANGQYKGSCSIPFIGLGKSEVQVWSDNYLISNTMSLGYQNPSKVQGTEYQNIHIWAEGK
jgi:hypothetical protein